MASSNLRRFRLGAAHRLRSNATDAERRLWRELRKLVLAGTQFRRQVPIGPYVADFGCMPAKLLIEVDGSQHGLKKNIDKDEARTRWLDAEGYRVLRFWNNDIITNLKGVMEAIYAELYGSIDAEPKAFKHKRFPRYVTADHPTPARSARRPSPSRGG
jgi:very-short-patch-repair endonuclease